MPELPEVEIVRRGLAEFIVGHEVESVKVCESPKSFPNDPKAVEQFLVGASVVAVRRRAKVLLIDLSSEYTLVVHLKMTGQLVYTSFAKQTLSGGTQDQESSMRFGAGHPSDSLVGELPDRSTRVIIDFTDGSHLYFNDQRKFGWMKLYPSVEVPNIKFMQKVGPEPLDRTFTRKEFITRVRRHDNTTIKAAILDQSVLAGVGNIYADESLWGAQIHPATRVHNVNDDQIAILLDEVKSVMSLSIERGGSTDKNFVNPEGKKGSYLNFARVFRREGLDCPRCGSIIEKIRVAGRGTHVCPHCQVLQ